MVRRAAALNDSDIRACDSRRGPRVKCEIAGQDTRGSVGCILPGMRAIALVLLVGCGGGSWKPVVWREPPADPKAAPVEVPFPDGTNGTELVVALLAHAKGAEATGISRFEIEVGGCTRTVTVARRAVAPEPMPELDRITLRVREGKLFCRTLVDQKITPGSNVQDPDGRRNRLGDASLVEREECDLQPIEHVVTRYRFEVDHKFTTPDWAEIARFMHVDLAFDTPHCGQPAKNEMRAVIHHGDGLSPPVASNQRFDAGTVITLATRAEAAKLPGEATDLAQQAIDAVAANDPMAGLDDARANELAERIAAAHFFAVAIDVDTFLHRELPPQITEAWATEIGADIDRIAKRYERIKDLVRIPVAIRWLRAGAERLAALHEHTAKLLDEGNQTKAADAERAKAAALLEVTK